MTKQLADIFKSFLGSVLWSLCAIILAYLNVGNYLPLIKRYNYRVEIGAVSLVLSLMTILCIITWLLLARRPLHITNGRVGAMEANVRILRRKEPRNRIKKYILSTRVSFWPLSEEEKARTEFREILTKKIKEGILVRRIWQIHNIDDIDRLSTYLELYKFYDNYSVKCFIGKSGFIPEVLSVYGDVVSVSIPQKEDPRRLTTAFHFWGKKEIIRWEEYFEILWDHSISIKIGSNVFYNNLDEIKGLIKRG